MLIHGSCHCGNVRLELEWPNAQRIPARACGCNFCVKHGGVWTSHPEARLRVMIADRGKVHDYAFGTRTATFHVCTCCGVVAVVTSDIAGLRYAVVNVNALDGVEAALFDPSPANFDGEGTDDRLARRRRNWIGSVELQC